MQNNTSEERIKFRVSRDHIRKSIPHDSRFCAVRQAIVDGKNWGMARGDKISVRSHLIRIRRGREVFTWDPNTIQVRYDRAYSDQPPLNLSAVIDSFDSGEPLHPFDFILDFTKAAYRIVNEVDTVRLEQLEQARDIGNDMRKKGIRSGVRKPDYRPGPVKQAEVS